MFPAHVVEQMYIRLEVVASELGVPFAPRDHAPNTKKALALSELARRRGVLPAFRAAAMDAHWADGRDLEHADVLADLARSAGLDADEALAFLDDPDVGALLEERRREAWQWGVTGIPTWFILPPAGPPAIRGHRPTSRSPSGSSAASRSRSWRKRHVAREQPRVPMWPGRLCRGR